MALHFLRTTRVADDLAARNVSAAEQAGYLVISFLAWTVPFYLYLIPAPRAEQSAFAAWLWLIEFVLVVAIFIGGVHYCLRKCRVDPRANFLVDFSCLYAPVALSTSIVIWTAFHLVALLPAFSPAHAYDALRLVFYLAATLVIFWRVGKHMERLSGLRQ
jgi:cation transport ATPase